MCALYKPRGKGRTMRIKLIFSYYIRLIFPANIETVSQKFNNSFYGKTLPYHGGAFLACDNIFPVYLHNGLYLWYELQVCRKWILLCVN